MNQLDYEILNSMVPGFKLISRAPISCYLLRLSRAIACLPEI